jgi:hypothetical protein
MTSNEPAPSAEPASQEAAPALPPLLDAVWPPDLRQAEDLLVQARRELPNVPALPNGPGAPSMAVGLALSGGGIRSATFCLGFVQALAAKRLLGVVDYLSTVSGGGYLGSFLGALFSRHGKDETDRLSTVKVVLSSPRSYEMRWLRENGRYLSPNGSGDLWAALAAQLRNWCSVVLVMGLFWLTCFLALNTLRTALERWRTAPVLLSDWFRCPFPGDFWWWSPTWLLVAGALVLAVVIGWTLWLIPRWREWRRVWPQWAFAGLVFGLSGMFLLIRVFPVGPYAPLPWIVAILSGVVMECAIVLVVIGLTNGPDQADAFRRIRVWANNWLAHVLVTMAVLIVVAVLDSLGQSLYLSAKMRGATGAIKALVAATGLASVVSLGKGLSSLSRFLPASARKLPVETIALIAGVLGVGLFLLNLDLLGHGITWNWSVPGSPESKSLPVLLAATGVGFVLSLLAGQHVPFLNQSSLQTLYGSRVARAYLGASNPTRKTSKRRALTELVDGDDVWLKTYHPHARGGPLHLINVTFNETCSAQSNIEQRDRKGLQFAVGPCGLSVGRIHHALWAEPGAHQMRGDVIAPIKSGSTDFPVFPPKGGAARPVENLSIGHWIALSGAAFGTGTGSRNCLGFSLLAGLTNVRLGYWWDSEVKPAERLERTRPTLSQQMGNAFSWMFAVQSHLLDEWLARFHGPARRRWYLSDGGHFENTGVYELIRRRLAYIVCCDCGQDEAYAFGDLSNLVRKARLDFDADIRPLDRAALDRLRGTLIPESVFPALGTLDELSRTESRTHHGLLATVCYEGRAAAESLILFVKPVVVGDEPTDVREYQHGHPAFPHEPTSDQYFNEAQWESYRKLGEHSGEALLGPEGDPDWWFTKLKPEDL